MRNKVTNRIAITEWPMIQRPKQFARLQKHQFNSSLDYFRPIPFESK